MNYQACLDWLFSQLPMYQRQGKAAYKADLHNTIAFSNYLYHPEKLFKSIHVGGTNGKGSVSHMLASVFQEAGYKVGLYTSPHLIDFRERIKINGEMISQDEVIDFVQKHQAFMKAQQLSFFEMTVGLAFSYFASQKVDIAIIEVGLGGRLDSTNIIQPELSVITNISLDHTAFLGNTIADIAFEKAGIIKPATPVVIGEYHSESSMVFERKAKEMKAPIYFASSFQNPIIDLESVHYKKKNKQTVLASLAVLKSSYSLPDKAIEQGILKMERNTGLQGRWQVLQEHPKVICDTGHNPAGIAMVVEELSKETFAKLHIVFGMVNDKEVKSILHYLPKQATYYFCQPSIPRALASEILFQAAIQLGFNGSCFTKVEEAYEAALQIADTQDLIFIGGSTFVVADILTFLQEKKN